MSYLHYFDSGKQTWVCCQQLVDKRSKNIYSSIFIIANGGYSSIINNIVMSCDLATDNGSKWLFLRQTSNIYLVQQKCEVYNLTADNEHDFCEMKLIKQ